MIASRIVIAVKFHKALKTLSRIQNVFVTKIINLPVKLSFYTLLLSFLYFFIFVCIYAVFRDEYV